MLILIELRTTDLKNLVHLIRYSINMRLPSLLIIYILLRSLAFGYAQNEDENAALLKKISSAKDTAKANALNTLAKNLTGHDPVKSLLYATEALNQSKSNGYKEGEARASSTLGVLGWISGDYNQAMVHLEKAFALFSELKNLTELANVHNLMGLIHCRKGDYKRAEDNYSEALALFKQKNDTIGISRVYSNLGIVFGAKGELTKALEYYFEASKLNGNNNASLSTNIGNIYCEQRDFLKALNYYTRAKEISFQKDDKNGIGLSHSNIGTTYYNLKNYDSALVHFQHALNYYKAVENKNGLSETYYRLGNVNSDKGKREEAFIQYEKALLIQKETGNKEGESSTLIGIARLYQTGKNYTYALNYYNQALAIAREIGAKRNITETSLELSSIYEASKDYANAFKYYKEYAVYKDSIFNKESNDKLLSLETQYETEKKENEIEILNKEVQLKEAHTNLLYAGLGFIAVIASLIINFQVSKSRKNKKLLHAEIEKSELDKKILQSEVLAKEKELEFNKNTLLTYTQHLLEKNTLLEELNEKLQELESDRPEDIEKITKINQLTSSKIITEEDWEQFKDLFGKVYEDFFIKLKKEYPGITTAESRLAALIKLNISSKKIASMIGISDDSVKKTRQRLRKKMNLDTEEGLEEAIHQM